MSTEDTPPSLPPMNGEAAEQKDEATADVRKSGRKRRVKSFSSGTPQKKATKRKKVKDAEKEHESDWICSECREAECMMKPEAEHLIICEGRCKRLFHYPCAGLNELPKEEESYICQDCTKGQHACCICKEYGKDDEDVFCCKRDLCGLFFHEGCLEMHGVEVQLVETEDDKPATRVFTCPAHACWTCSQSDRRQQEKDAAVEARKETEKRITGKKRKKKAKGFSSAFSSKSEAKIHRCLECPIAFHVSCIPPSAKFHELGVLCHEHAATHKLPDLDPEASFQAKIEEKADKFFDTVNSSPRKRRGRQGRNPFIPIPGDTRTSYESKLTEKIRENDLLLPGGLHFCLPCDVRDEVHSKPPTYKHVHSLQYDKNNRPPRIAPPGTDRCHCVGVCGDNCYNRMVYTECYGDISKNSKTNCSVGVNCGNRQVAQRKSTKCKPMREQGKGWGLVAVEKAEKGKFIQEYVGEVIDEAMKEERLQQWAEEHPNDPNFYIMALNKGWFVDAREVANLSRFINHSCDPNCVLIPVNVGGYIRNAIVAKYDIPAGTFLSYDYRFDTRQGDRFLCRCGAAKCRGTMKEAKLENAQDVSTKNAGELWEAAKAQVAKDKNYIREYYAQAEELLEIGESVPGHDNPEELVANGPQRRNRGTAIRNRIFLWRNTVDGANFAQRVSRLGK